MKSEHQRAGRFILATNVLDAQELSNDHLLRDYIAQQSTERGFRFLKDPLFFTSSVFLNSRLAGSGFGDGNGSMPTGLQLGAKGTASSLGTDQTDHQQSIGQAYFYSHYALGVSVFHVNSSGDGCWCQAHCQPYR